VSADEFGAMLDEEEARGAAAAAAESAAPPAPPAERDARPPRRERGGRSSRRDRGDQRDADAPRPQQREQRAAPAATFSRTPHGVEEWFSPARLDACQRAVHYHFRDMSLLENALTHSSIKSHDRPSYERMEFLGDSVIGLVIAEYLYNLLPDCDEGELTKVKSLVVSTDGLADAAKDCGLDKFLAVGRGILMKDAVPRSLIADVFEGVVGAVYLDRGYETVRLYVLDLLGPRIKEAISDRGARNFKSVLQQVAQRDFGETPFYEVLRESGPEHARVFEVVAVVGRRRFGVARAATKKEAEQAAAKLALQTILMEKSSRKPPPRRRRSR
jgi:ribonuclease-3